MSSYICTQCGYHITAEEGVKVGTCPACQSLFVFPNQFAQKENLYRLATEARLNGNYDMALNYYSRILKVDAAEPEANWGYLLSKYGIDISNDAIDYGNVLFHRVEHTSFMGDPAYEKMIAYVPQASRYYYEGKSREIEAQHKKLLAISAAIQAPDIYIDCTAEPGTQDFLLSAQVGKALEDAGYRVFHPGMLNGVARRDYNLYEMAAAEKAQALIVVFTSATKREDVRFQAVWKRFLAYRKQDAGRKMLSVFQGLRPQDLPLELQALQSILCEGTDFSDKVLNEINAMFGRQSRSAALVKENLKLLRDGQDAMDRQDFNRAYRLFEKAAANDAQEYRAHWGMVCARTKGLTVPLLSDDLDQSCRQAIKLADKATAAGYREAMSQLMQDTVWARLKTETNDFQDWEEDAEERAQKSVERVNLYLPPMDPRFQELDDWRQAIRRQREMDDIREAYTNRDASVEPLFAEQDKAEYDANELYDLFEDFFGKNGAATKIAAVYKKRSETMDKYTECKTDFVNYKPVMQAAINTDKETNQDREDRAYAMFLKGMFAMDDPEFYEPKLTDNYRGLEFTWHFSDGEEEHSQGVFGYNEIRCAADLGSIPAIYALFTHEEYMRPPYTNFDDDDVEIRKEMLFSGYLGSRHHEWDEVTQALAKAGFPDRNSSDDWPDYFDERIVNEVLSVLDQYAD